MKKIEKKLTLNKSMVSKLNDRELDKIHGGTWGSFFAGLGIKNITENWDEAVEVVRDAFNEARYGATYGGNECNSLGECQWAE